MLKMGPILSLPNGRGSEIKIKNEVFGSGFAGLHLRSWMISLSGVVCRMVKHPIKGCNAFVRGGYIGGNGMDFKSRHARWHARARSL